MKQIELTQNQFAIVSDEDYEELNRFSWYAAWKESTQSYQARRAEPLENGKQRNIKMHRQIMGVTDPKQQIDHINHNTLDNTRTNLRVVDNRGNQANKKGKKTRQYSSVFVGVCKVIDPKRAAKPWRAQIHENKKQRFLGYFETEVEAMEAHQKALYHL